jgi:glycosyltransferase involved in cell wall biosynthesis
MKILLTCDPEIPVPPTNYGGIERIVDGLAKGYSQLGHEVYLIAHPESICKYTKKNFSWPSLHSRGAKNIIKNAYQFKKVTKQVNPDLIHSFSRLLYLYPIFFTSKIRVIQSYQREISAKSTGLAKRIAGPKLTLTACGQHMISNLPKALDFKAIHNFTDIDFFTCNPDIKKEHLLFLGRIEDIKGSFECIQTAIATNTKLIIAGNISKDHDNYFNEKIKPHLAHPLINYVGPVNDEQKLKLLQSAIALLFPIKWEEPFGIVMAESLSCGTPVIGFNRGSVPEVITDKEIGFVVENLTEMISKVLVINSIDRNLCAKIARLKFNINTISNNYLNLIEDEKK